MSLHGDIGLDADADRENKVSYCKQIAHQHSQHSSQKKWPGLEAVRGRVDHVKIDLSSSLIIMQNLPAV